MAVIELIYKSYLENEKIENIINKSYYFTKIEFQKELFKEEIANILIEDGYNPNYIELISKYEYLIMKKEERIQMGNIDEKDLINKLIDLRDEPIIFDEKDNYILYLHIIIDPEKEKERIKNEKEKRKNKQINIIEKQFPNINQISKELNDIGTQLKYLNKNIKKEQNEMIKCIKKSLYKNRFVLSKYNIKKIKTTIENQHNEQLIFTNNYFNSCTTAEILYGNTNTSIYLENDNEIINLKRAKIFYLFSFLKKSKDIIVEDYSYYKQFLGIYNNIAKKENIKIDLNLKIIKENLFLEQEPDVLHLRVDSKKNEKNQIFFIWEKKKDMEYFEYSLDKLIVYFEKIVNVKLLIISSQNISEIRNRLNALDNLKQINKIYINHSNEFEKEENSFIQSIYYNMINKEQTIKNSCELFYDKNNIFIDIKNHIKCFDEKIIMLEHEHNSKDILDFEMMKNNYCIIGRLNEFYQVLHDIQIHEKMCVFGTRGVGKKSFVKKVGFLALERNIFNKVYFLEINKIDNNNHELKINLLIDEIYECYGEKKVNILLIIYFNEPIIVIYKLKKLIYSFGNKKKDNIRISYIFTFTLGDSLKNEDKEELSPSVELKHFHIYGKQEKKMSYFKNLFNICLDEYQIMYKNNIKDLINKMFDKMINTDSEQKPIRIHNVNNENIKSNLLNKVSKNINAKMINQNEKKENISNEVIIKQDNKSNAINDNQKKETKENFEGAKINNIFLLVNYIYFSKDDNQTLKDIFNKLIKEDDKEIKIKLISNIISNSRNKNFTSIDKIILYLVKLISGIGQSTLKRILNDKSEEKIEFIKKELFGIIITEHNGYENIFRLDDSFKPLIEEIYFKEKKIEKKQIEIDIFKEYFFSLRYILSDFEIDQGFHGFINNNFWFRNDEEKLFFKYFKYYNNDKYIFNLKIDLNNIYNLINKNNYINYKDERQIFIDNISITLPTLLYFTNNFYFEYIMIEFFEKLYANIKEVDNTLKINELILRLGLFKYWISRNPHFFENTLKIVGINENKNINLNDNAKFEFYLSKIYDCIIKKDKNIDEFINECEKLLLKLKMEKGDIDDNYFINKNRLDNICAEANAIFEKDKSNKFYFLLESPLKNEYKTVLNNNYCLTQKLFIIIPPNFDVEFKTNLNDIFREENNFVNISFLYLSSKRYKDEAFEICNKKKLKKININIKILVLGYLDNKEKFNKEELIKNGINNLIYLYKNDNINFHENVKNYNNKSFYYFFEQYFTQFIHFFIYLLTSSYDFQAIKTAFIKAKNNFINKFKRICESNNIEQQYNLAQSQKKDELNTENQHNNTISAIENLINMESTFENDYFEIESVDKEEKINNQQKIIQDMYDEDEYKYNKNVYYRKNPFSAKSETQLKKKKNKNFVKLPGIKNLSQRNFLRFVEKELYDINKEIVILENKIYKNRIVNIFGKNNVFDLGDELCKYFYMSGKFKGGVFIISPRYIEEEKDYLIENINFDEKQNNYNKILILSKIFNEDINMDVINELAKIINKTSNYFLICSENKLEKLEGFKECNLNSL